jgi:hypothetical protein
LVVIRPVGSKSGTPTRAEYRNAADDIERKLTAITPQLTGEPLEVVSEAAHRLNGLLRRDKLRNGPLNQVTE